MTRFIILFSLVLISYSSFGQLVFLAEQEEVFKKSTEQWLVQELTKNHPSHFADRSYSDKTTLFAPPTDNEPVLGIAVKYGYEEALIFQNLYFPDHKVERYIQLHSICDLYFPLIEKKLSLAGLPKEFKFLPLLMSGMNPAHTDNRDRAGLFGMDYLSARYQQLRMDSVVDERRGGDFAIDAAIKELKSIHQSFNGNAELTLKAWYVSRAYAKRISSDQAKEWQSIDDDADFFVQFFVYSTKLFKQTYNRVNNQLHHYFDILGNYESINFTQPVYFEGLSALTGADIVAMKKLNPIFIGDRIEANYKKVSFILDNRYTGKFKALEDSIYKWTPKPKVIPTETMVIEENVYHVVRKGESLGVIARKHKTTIAQIKKWNKLRSDKIRAGQRLKIVKTTRKRVPKAEEPETKEEQNIDPTAVPDAVLLDNANKPDTTKVTPPPKPKPVAPKQDEIVNYKVKNGDTLWAIAKKHKVSPEDIMKWNKCGEKIRPGQVLKIHTK